MSRSWSVKLGPVVGAGSSLTQSVTDAAGNVDTVARGFGVNRVDTTGSVDTWARDVALVRTDPVGNVDTATAGLPVPPATSDLRFTTNGTYVGQLDGGTVLAAAPPWGGEECIGAQSKIVVYDAGTIPTGAPAPLSTWSSKAAKFDAYNDGSHASVRSQVRNDSSMVLGGEYYIGFSVFVPSALAVNNFPGGAGNGDFFVIHENFLESTNHSPAVGVGLVYNSGQLAVSGECGSNGRRSLQNISFDTWVPIVEHVVVAKNAAGGGLREMWVNNVKQTWTLPLSGAGQSNFDTTGQSLSADHMTMFTATYLNDGSGDQWVYLNNYRTGTGSSFGTPSTVTIYHAGLKVGSAFASVDPS